MLSTIFAITLTTANGLSAEPSCADEATLLQQVSRLTSKSQIQHGPYGPDKKGLCNWGSVLGPSIPNNKDDMVTLIKGKCVDLYGDDTPLCDPLIAEFASEPDFFSNAGDFADESKNHLLCTVITDLVLATASHEDIQSREDSQSVALMKRAQTVKSQGTLEESVEPKETIYRDKASQIRQDALFYGPDERGVCNWASVLGKTELVYVTDVKNKFFAVCEEAYPQPNTFCDALTDELFEILGNVDENSGRAKFHTAISGHPLFCVTMTDLILASYAHQARLGHHASLLSRAQSGQGSETLESTVSGKFMGNSLSADSLGPHPWQSQVDKFLEKSLEDWLK